MSLSDVPPEVWTALSHLLTALVGWLVPGPSRRYRVDVTSPHRRRRSDL